MQSVARVIDKEVFPEMNEGALESSLSKRGSLLVGATGSVETVEEG